MKKVLFIMMLGLMFGQLKVDYIKYKNNANKFIEYRNIDVLSEGDNNMKLVIETGRSFRYEYVNCSQIKELIFNGESILCNSFEEMLTRRNLKEIKKNEKYKEILNNRQNDVISPPINIGAFMIGIGAGILYLNMDAECENCNNFDELEDFTEDINSTHKIGYAFIMIGGFLSAYGI